MPDWYRMTPEELREYVKRQELELVNATRRLSELQARYDRAAARKHDPCPTCLGYKTHQGVECPYCGGSGKLVDAYRQMGRWRKK